jgi:hypothetical protein
MMFPQFHPLPIDHRAIEFQARQMVLGSLSRAEVIASCFAAAQQNDPAYDPSGLRCRISWAVDDAARSIEARRDHAQREIKRLVATLMDQGHDPRPDMDRLHKRLGSPLATAELREILDEEARWWGFRQRKARRYG